MVALKRFVQLQDSSSPHPGQESFFGQRLCSCRAAGDRPSALSSMHWDTCRCVTAHACGNHCQLILAVTAATMLPWTIWMCMGKHEVGASSALRSSPASSAAGTAALTERPFVCKVFSCLHQLRLVVCPAKSRADVKYCSSQAVGELGSAQLTSTFTHGHFRQRHRQKLLTRQSGLCSFQACCPEGRPAQFSPHGLPVQTTEVRGRTF